MKKSSTNAKTHPNNRKEAWFLWFSLFPIHTKLNFLFSFSSWFLFPAIVSFFYSDKSVTNLISPDASWSLSDFAYQESDCIIGAARLLNSTDTTIQGSVKELDNTAPIGSWLNTSITLDTVVTHETCNRNDGAIDLIVIGGFPPLTYNWSDGMITEDRTGLSKGTYTVTVNDVVANSSILSVYIDRSNQPVVNPTVDSVTCYGGNDGAISLSVSYGTPPFTFTWSDLGLPIIGDSTRSGLSAGEYRVNVEDTNGCKKNNLRILVAEPDSLQLGLSISNVNCFSNTADIATSVSGGIMPYTYSWSTGATTTDLTGVSGGTYSVTIIDQNGCSVFADTTIVTNASLQITSIPDSVDCFEGNNGSIDITVIGGSPPFSYLWSNGDTTEDISALAAGTYTVSVGDALSCVKMSSSIVSEPPGMNLVLSADSVSCAGASDANVYLSVSDGLAPYTYSWSSGATSEDLTNVGGQNHIVTITDADGCSQVDSILVFEPNVLAVIANITHVSSFGGSDGEIGLVPSGGMQPYTYAWSTGATVDSLSGLPAGDYTATVTDKNGCTNIVVNTIVELIPTGSLQKIVSHDSIQTGREFTYTIRYSCAGTAGDCQGVRIVDTLPSEVRFINLDDNFNHSSNSYYDAGNHLVVFELDKETGNGLLAGSSGEVRVTVAFENGSTSNGTIAENQAFWTTNNTAPTISNQVSTKALAEETWVLNKTLSNSPIYIDVPTTYTITVRDPGRGDFGSLEVANVLVVDTLPVGATFVSATGAGSYDATSHSVSWAVGNFPVINGSDQSQTFEVTIIYPSANFSGAETVINKAIAIGQPTGDTTQVIAEDDDNQVLTIPNPSATIDKRIETGFYPSIGNTVRYGFNIENNGTAVLDSFQFIDTIPAQLELSGIRTGGYQGGPVSLTISYQTNLDANWRNWPGSPFNATTDVYHPISELSLGLGEYVTVFRYYFDSVYPGFENPGNLDADIYATIINPDHDGNSVYGGDTITNCTQLSYEFNGVSGQANGCELIYIRQPEVRLTKAVSSYDINIGDSYTYYLRPRNYGGTSLDSFTLIDTLPESFDFTSLTIGRWNNSPATNLFLRYQTNLTTSWTDWPGAPFDGSTDEVLDTTGLTLADGEYVTMLFWDFGDVPVGFNYNTQASITGVLLPISRSGDTLQSGDIVTNCAFADAYSNSISYGERDCADVRVNELDPEQSLSKSRNTKYVDIGDDFYYQLDPVNTGTVGLDSFLMIDTIPQAMEFVYAYSGDWQNPPTGNYFIRYQTNLNNTWTDWPSAPFNFTTNQTLNRSALGLAAGEYVSMLMWDFGNVPVGFEDDGTRPRIYGNVLFTDRLSNTVNPGDTILNCAQLSSSYTGSTLDSEACDFIITRAPDPPSVRMDKIRGNSSRRIGQEMNYVLVPYNNGGYPLDSFVMIDTIPDQMDFTRTESGGWNNAPNTNLTVRYQTNLNSSWTDWPGGPFDGSTDVQLNRAALSLAVGEYVTLLMWDFGSVPVGFTHDGNRPRIYGYLLATDRNGDKVFEDDAIVNCAHLTAQLSGVTYADADCDAINARWPRLESDPYKTIELSNGSNTTSNGPYYPGDTITFEVRVENDGSSEVDLPNPIAMDLLPAKLSYVPGSWVVTANSSGAPTPNFEVLPDYNALGRTLLRWSWTGTAAFDFPRNRNTYIQFKTVVSGNASAGETLVNRFYQTSEDPAHDCDEGDEQDVYDLDGDGLTNDYLCFDNSDVNITIGTAVSIQSSKFVKGQLDSAYTRFPEIAATVPGGIADYQLLVKNNGTVPMSNIILIDILPHVGDQGVISALPRYSRWQPNLVGPVSAPSGVSVYYSTEKNPCRDTEGIDPSGPAGCAAPNWSITPPTDITSVQSIKFDFGTTILNPGDEFQLSWPMRAPVMTLDSIGALADSVSWNSFGFIATRTDDGSVLLPSEPVKVGVTVEQLTPAVFGDYVWNDVNQNGVQNGGEVGIDGIRVELYKDNGDGIANPAVDTFVNFTSTANGGFYIFPNLPAGDYFAIFYKPPAYEISPVNASGNNANDSDGSPTTFNGFSVAITPITNLAKGEIELNYDLGLFASPNGAIGNYVWNDINGNGLQDEALVEGINGITVNIYENSDPSTIFKTTLTHNDPSGNPGFYSFDTLAPGDYFIEVVLPILSTFTSQGAMGVNDPADSDIDPGTGRSEIFTTVAGNYNDTWDAGIILPTGNLSIGNIIWEDLDADGIFEPGDGESGINGVAINLYVDIDANNQFTPGTDQFFKTTTSFTNAGTPGYYLFGNLPAADYIIQIPTTNFSTSAPLDGMVSVDGSTIAVDPDDDQDRDDNGYPMTGYGVVSKAITLIANSEPINDGDLDNNSNLSLDFGVYPDCNLSIDNISVGNCTGVPGCNYTVDVTLSWYGAAIGDTIQILTTNTTEYIAVNSTSSPNLVTLTLPADGTLSSDTVFLSFLHKNICEDWAPFIPFKDTIAPVFINTPVDTTLNCGEAIPSPTIVISDNCDASSLLSQSELVIRPSRAGILDSCEATVRILDIQCHDNTTPGMTTDDLFTLTLEVNNNGLNGVSWSMDINSNTYSGNYGDTITINSLTPMMSPLNFTLYDQIIPTCKSHLLLELPANGCE